MYAKHFFKGLSWLLLLNLLVKPVWIFVIDRQVQNVVGHEVYGTYFALLNLCYVLLFVADAGLSNMLTQKLASQEDVNVQQLVRLKAAMLVLYATACCVVALLSGVEQWNILLYLVVVQGLMSLFLFLRSLLAARQHFKTDAFFSVLDKTLLLMLCVGPLYGFFRPMTITLFLQLQAVSISVATVGLLLFLLFKKHLTAGHSIAFKTLAGWTAPFVLIILLMSAHNRLDAFLLERIHANGALQAGIYAMAYRLLDAGNVAGYMTASFLVPFLSRHQYDRSLLQRVVLLSRHVLLFLSAGVVAFVFVFAAWLQQAMYHSTDAYSSLVMQLCLFSLPAYYLIHVYGSVLTATSRFTPFIRVLLLTVLCNVLLNFLLIPQYGALGCCIAALVTQYGCGLFLWAVASHRLQISPSAGTALLYLAAAVFLAFAFWFGQSLSRSSLMILCSLVLIAFIAFAVQRNLIQKVFLSFNK